MRKSSEPERYIRFTASALSLTDLRRSTTKKKRDSELNTATITILYYDLSRRSLGQKEPADALRCASKIVQKNKNVKLLLPGQPIRLEEYKQMVAERGIAENVDFLGYRRDINNLVGLSDLSVASSFQEGLPINLIEAMAMGNPIVATDVRGNNDAVEDGVNGYLVPVGDSGMIAEKYSSL